MKPGFWNPGVSPQMLSTILEIRYGRNAGLSDEELSEIVSLLDHNRGACPTCGAPRTNRGPEPAATGESTPR